MTELTSEDRELIQQQIVAYKEQQPVACPPTNLPKTPDGREINKDLEDAINQESIPNKREAHSIKRKIRGIWRRWRTVTLDAKSLETEKYACQIKIERAEAQAKLNEIRRANELKQLEHWLNMHRGNLQEINYNANSKPSMFWYHLKRTFFYITNLTDTVPKLIKNLFFGGMLVLILVLLKRYGII